MGIIAESGEGTMQYLRAGSLETKKRYARRGAASIQVEHHVVPLILLEPSLNQIEFTVREKLMKQKRAHRRSEMRRRPRRPSRNAS